MLSLIEGEPFQTSLPAATLQLMREEATRAETQHSQVDPSQPARTLPPSSHNPGGQSRNTAKETGPPTLIPFGFLS